MKQHLSFSLLIILLALFVQAGGQGNNIYFQKISNAENLSQSTVNAILKDKIGFLWFGTEDGLNLYNGYQIKVYKHIPGNKNSLSHSAIWSVFEDDSGTLWIGTFNGLNKYDRESDSFTTFQSDPGNPSSLSDNYVRSIVEDNQGLLWVGTNMGLNRYHKSEDKFVRYINQPEKGYNPNGNIINAMIIDHLGKLWVGTNDGLRIYNEKSDTFITYNLPEKYSRNRISSIYEDADGRLWIGTENYGLFSFNRNSLSFEPFDLNMNEDITNLRINSIAGSGNEIIWVGTNQGLYRILLETLKTELYKHDFFNEHSILDNEIKSLLSEQSGFVWIGTINRGINLINPSKNRFGHISSGKDGSSYFKINVVRSIHEKESGDLLVGTGDGGLIQYDPITGNSTRFPGRLGDMLKRQSINAIHIDGDIYWFGLRSGGLLKYEKSKDIYKQYLKEPEAGGRIRWQNVVSLHKDKSGILWIGSNGEGLYEFNPDTEVFIRHKHNPSDTNSISNDRIYSILEDHSGNLWVGTAGGGLNIFNQESRRFLSINRQNNDSTTREINYILCLHEDSNGNIWAGTFGSGLVRYDTESKQIQIFNESNGLPNNVIYGILEDDRGNLWLSHNQGISKFNIESATCLNFDERDGLQGNEFNSNASYRCRNGNLVFGGISGFNIFHPDSIRQNENIPPIVFTDLRISNREIPIGKMEDGRTILKKSITSASEVYLQHSDREIHIEFAALDYSVPGKNRYRYKLNERDEEWIDLGTINHVSFHDLPSGKNTLYVIGSNNDGKWNEDGIKITLVVTPPFYETALFYIVMVLSLLGILILYYYVRMKNLRAQKRELEMLIQTKTKEIAQQRDILELKNDELEHKNQSAREQAEKTAEMAERLEQANQSKLQFFTNITHEFRTPLTLILGFIEKLQNTNSEYKQSERIEDYKMIEKNANKLLKLINRLMQFRKLSTQQTSLQISENNLVDFIRNQAALYKNLADKKEINYTFQSGMESLNTWFDQEQMEEVITNLLSNAFKFSPNNSAIRVCVGKGNDQLFASQFDHELEDPEQYVYFFVEDNGIGIPANKQKLVFKRFYQVDSANTIAGQGMGAGIGLHISDLIVKMHKGQILLKSRPEEGTVFAVVLKTGNSHLSEYEFVNPSEAKIQNLIPEDEVLAPAEELSGDSLAINTTIEQLSKKDHPKILVIEDNNELRRFITKGLSDQYRVIDAENGSQAIKLLDEHDPEVIICDVLLPGKINGFDFVERTKSNISTSHIPIILLTALDSVDQKVLGLEKGADIYMTKPFSLRELKAHVQSIIQSRKTLKKKFREQAFLHTRELEISDKDETFIQKTIRIIEAGMSDPQFNVSYLCDAMNMSQTKLYRKVKALTDMTITDFIRGLRLRKASALLLETDKNVSEIAYEVGFNDPNYFGKCFKAELGQSPSEFVKEHKTNKS